MPTLLEYCFRFRGALVPFALMPAVWLTHRPVATVAAIAIGSGLSAWGLALRLAGVRRLDGRARVHRAAARELATTGIYAWVRNPIYLGNAMLLAGPVAVVWAPMAGLVSGAALLAIYSAAVRHEEAALFTSIGPRYRAYADKTNRWLPRRPAPGSGFAAATPASWRRVLRLERYPILLAATTPLCAFATPWLARMEAGLGDARRASSMAVIVLISLLLCVHIERSLLRRAAPLANPE